MMLPGFTAEITLYRANEHYRMTGHFSYAAGALYPALISLGAISCDPNCINSCLFQCESRFDRSQCRRECGAQCCMVYA
jgi:hypothetical protein